LTYLSLLVISVMSFTVQARGIRFPAGHAFLLFFIYFTWIEHRW